HDPPTVVQTIMAQPLMKAGEMLAAPPRREAPPPPPCTMVIFGAGGDLTKRLLVPALYNLARTGLLPADFALVGVDLAEMDTAGWRASLRTMMQEFVGRSGAEDQLKAIDETVWNGFSGRMSYLRGDLTDQATYRALGTHLAEVSGTAGTQDNCLFYLAVADRFFEPVIDQLGSAGLLDQQARDGKPEHWRRVVIEKPFGHDLTSAQELNARILQRLTEDQIYRIDHFLGKETVQNTVAETVGVERRGRFYEKTGALRDMVPNHVFQLLAMVAMEPPAGFDARSVRSRKADVFAAMRSVTEHDAVRGQYGPGPNGAVAYRQEPDV